LLALPISIPQPELTQFCQANQIRKLSLFGSVLTPRFHAESDVDILVEFIPQFTPSLLDLVRLESKLSSLIGRKVDLKTPSELSRYFRHQVLNEALPQYEQR